MSKVLETRSSITFPRCYLPVSFGSAAEIELIKSRMVLGKTVTDLNLNTVVEQKYFPIFGQGWNRLMGNEHSKIALSRLSIPLGWSEKTSNWKLSIKITSF